MSGVPVVIASNGLGLPVHQVTSGAPVMTVATNGRGIPIVLSDRGAPFVVQGAGYDLTTYYAAMSVQPDAARKALMQSFANSLLSAGLTTALRAIYLTAAHDVQATRINMLNPSEVATIVGGVTYTLDTNLKGNAVDGVVTTAIADNNAAPWSQNAASMVAYVNVAPAVGGAILGVSGALATRLTGGSSAATNGRIHVNSIASGTTANSFGLTVANRTGPTTLEIWRNGALETTQTTTTTSPPTAGVFELFRNNASYSDAGVAAWGIGGNLTPTQQLAFFNALDTYLAALGAS